MSDYVGLNVGGKIYQTSRSTLARYPNNFFDGLLDGGMPSAKDDRGNYLVDRDGEIFRHILNFMRSGKLVLPGGFNYFDLLERDADFYRLDTLQTAINELKSTINYVHLNVGGKIYHTSQDTLTRYPNSFFTDMLDEVDGVPSAAKDNQGNYLIDQDGEMFRHVLNFMRYGELKLPDGFKEIALLERMANYFSLDEMIIALQNEIMIGFVIAKKIYKVSRGDVLREPDSLFTKTLSGEDVAPVDQHGNFVIDRNTNIFLHIIGYLRYGETKFFKGCRLKSFELENLKKEANYYGLNKLASYIAYSHSQ